MQRIDSQNFGDFVAVLSDLWNQKKLKNENFIFIQTSKNIEISKSKEGEILQQSLEILRLIMNC